MDFATVNGAALAVLPALVARWLPAGRREGREWCVGSLTGEPGRSLKINLQSGVWRDFAAGVGGSDPVSLAAALHGLSQAEAARLLADMLAVPVSDNRSGKPAKPCFSRDLAGSNRHA